MPTSPLALTALACATLAVIILVTYLVRRPPLDRATKVALLFGLGIFPIGAAATGNVQGFETTKQRRFCGSCHVMGAHESDADDPASGSLSSRHARNPMFGGESCYTCHADYGMYGTVLTKMDGMKHVYHYYAEYRTMPLEEAKHAITIHKPFPNANCMQCHSTMGEVWLKVPDHRATVDDVRGGRLSCASAGCHGLAHPNFTQPAPVASVRP